jgi:hypothetical protein
MRNTLFVLLLSIVLAGSAAAQDGRSSPGAEEFTAFALSTGGPRTSPVATNVDIVIERWSSEADRRRLLGVLGKGQSAMLDTLRDLRRVGYIRTPGSLGWDLHYAHEVRDEDGGRRIFIATDRPISIWEAVNRPRSIDYPFTFIELRLNAHGEGEGKLSLATRVIADDEAGIVHLEQYDTQPVMLTEVKRRR